MYKSISLNESNLPLEINGYEANTAQDVFVLTRPLDAHLKLSLDANGYIQRSNIMLTDGRIIEGWVKI